MRSNVGVLAVALAVFSFIVHVRGQATEAVINHQHAGPANAGSVDINYNPNHMAHQESFETSTTITIPFYSTTSGIPGIPTAQTQLNATAEIGTTYLSVMNAAGFLIGNTVLIDPGFPQQENNLVTGINVGLTGHHILLQNALMQSHQLGALVVMGPPPFTHLPMGSGTPDPRIAALIPGSRIKETMPMLGAIVITFATAYIFCLGVMSLASASGAGGDHKKDDESDEEDEDWETMTHHS